MTYTTPRTWATDDLVDEIMMNTHVRDNIAHLASFGSGGTMFSAMTPVTDLVRMATGSYTGNGADNRNITGVGFTPKAVFIFRAGGNQQAFNITGTDSTWYSSGGAEQNPAADLIQAFAADGFQVGTSAIVNANGVGYYYLAMG